MRLAGGPDVVDGQQAHETSRYPWVTRRLGPVAVTRLLSAATLLRVPRSERPSGDVDKVAAPEAYFGV